jgi:hypothetical protein
MGGDVMQSIPREEMVFDRKARMKIPPVEHAVRPPAERIADFGDTSAVRQGVPAAQRHLIRHVAD